MCSIIPETFLQSVYACQSERKIERLRERKCWEKVAVTSSYRYGKGYLKSFASSAMYSDPSCQEQFHVGYQNNSFNTAIIPVYEVSRTCGCVDTEFEDTAITASPFCIKT